MKIKCFLLIILSLIILPAYAKRYNPETEGEFFADIEKKRHPLAIAFFVPYDVAPNKKDNLITMEDAFVNLSRDNRYKKDIDMAFIRVNLQKIPKVVSDFRLSIEQPTIMFFKDGKVVKKKDNIVKEVGFLNENELKEIIEEYFKTDIDKIKKRQEEIERIRQEAQQKSEKQAIVLPSKVLPVQQQPVEEVKYVTYPSQTTTYVYDDSYGYGRPYIGFGIAPGFWGGYGYRRRFRRGGGRGFGRRGFGGRGFGRRGGFGGRRGGRRGGGRGLGGGRGRGRR